MALIKKNTKLDTDVDVKYQNLREVCLMIDNYLKETYIKLDKDQRKNWLSKYIFKKGQLTKIINNIDSLIDVIKIKYGMITTNEEWEVIYSFVSADAENLQNKNNAEFSKIFYKACEYVKNISNGPF